MQRPRVEESKSPGGEIEVCSHGIEIAYVVDNFHPGGGTRKHLAHPIAGLPADELHCSVVAFDLGVNSLLDALTTRGADHQPVGGSRLGPLRTVEASCPARFIGVNRYDSGVIRRPSHFFLREACIVVADGVATHGADRD
jgi:hypothetical protein